MHKQLFCTVALASTCACALFDSVDNSVNNTVQGAAATHLAVVTVLQSPPIPGVANSPTASVATIFFGNRPTETTLEPAPVNGATVTITDDAGLSTPAPGVDAGLYLASSASGGLRYDPTADYEFKFVDDGVFTYTAAGSAPPQEVVAQLTTTFTDDGGDPEPVFAQIPHGTAFTLTRSAPTVNGQLDVAFITVFEINDMTQGAVTYTNAPQTPSDFLQLIVNDSQWRTASVTIPGASPISSG